MDYRRENLLQARLNKFAVAAIDRDSVIIDLAYLIAGLVTITQSRLVHRMLQGVEHTDPTEWSNSHLSIGDKFMLTVLRAIDSFFGQCSVSFQTAPQHFISDGSATFHFIFYGIRMEMVVTYMDTLYIITGCFLNSLRHMALYFN